MLDLAHMVGAGLGALAIGGQHRGRHAELVGDEADERRRGGAHVVGAEAEGAQGAELEAEAELVGVAASLADLG